MQSWLGIYRKSRHYHPSVQYGGAVDADLLLALYRRRKRRFFYPRFYCIAVCFVGLENLIDTEELALMEGAGAEVAGIMAITKVAALAYLIFNLYTPPCFAAIGAMNAEMKSAKWLWGGIGLQLAIGYTAAYLVYTIGTIIIGGTLNIGAAVGGAVAVAAMATVVIGLIINSRKKTKAEYALKSAK